MPNVTLKNVPEELYERLRESARRHRRSINSEILVALEKALGSTRVEPEEFLARLESIHQRLDLPRMTDEILKAAKDEGRP